MDSCDAPNNFGKAELIILFVGSSKKNGNAYYYSHGFHVCTVLGRARVVCVEDSIYVYTIYVEREFHIEQCGTVIDPEQPYRIGSLSKNNFRRYYYKTKYGIFSINQFPVR